MGCFFYYFPVPACEYFPAERSHFLCHICDSASPVNVELNVA